jgi:predicted lysophospholipase L1 biosynthesis ABC-type transport system permease subunit
MEHQKEQLEAIRDIRNLMERSSRFLSLSGLAGVIIGIAAITGVAAAYAYMGLAIDQGGYHTLILNENGEPNGDVFSFLLIDVLLVLVFSIATVTIMAMKNAEKKGLPIWDGTAKRMAVQLAVPMLAGAILSMILLRHGLVGLIAPVSLWLGTFQRQQVHG